MPLGRHFTSPFLSSGQAVSPDRLFSASCPLSGAQGLLKALVCRCPKDFPYRQGRTCYAALLWCAAYREHHLHSSS